MALIAQARPLVTKVASDHGFGGFSNSWWSNGSTHFVHPKKDGTGIQIWPWRGGTPATFTAPGVRSPVMIGNQVGCVTSTSEYLLDLSANLLASSTPPQGPEGSIGAGYDPVLVIPLPKWDAVIVADHSRYSSGTFYYLASRDRFPYARTSDLGVSYLTSTSNAGPTYSVSYLWETSAGYSLYGAALYADLGGVTEALALGRDARMTSYGGPGYALTGYSTTKQQSSKWQENFGYAVWPNTTYSPHDPNTASVPGVFYPDNKTRTASKFTTSPVVGPGAFLLPNFDGSLFFFADQSGAIGLVRKGDQRAAYYGTFVYKPNYNFGASQIVDADINHDGTEGLVVVSNYQGNTATFDTYHVDLSMIGQNDIVGADGVYLDPDEHKFGNSAVMTSRNFARW